MWEPIDNWGNRLTVSHNLSGYTWPQLSQPIEPLWTDPGLKSGIGVLVLSSTTKKKKKNAGRKWMTFHQSPHNEGKTPPSPPPSPPPPLCYELCVEIAMWQIVCNTNWWILCRYYVISRLPKLEVLDYKTVTADERSEATRIYGASAPVGVLLI